MMTLIGGRVIPFFTARGLGLASQAPARPWLMWSLLGGSLAIAATIAAGLGQVPSPWLAPLFLAVAVLHGLRLWHWRDRGIWRVPLLWSLHLAYAWLVLACLGMALWHAGLLGNASPPLHALTVGSMAGLILAMLARVSLGHTGRPLVLPRGMAAGFILLNVAALARVLLVEVWPALSLWLAMLCWAAALLIYLGLYAPMLCRPRVDGHPG